MNFNKKFWTMTLSAAMATSLLAGCGTSGSSADASASGSLGSNPGGEDGVFTIAYAPNESTTESADARNGLAKDLGEFLGCEVEEIQASDYNAIIEALRTGSADMAREDFYQLYGSLLFVGIFFISLFLITTVLLSIISRLPKALTTVAVLTFYARLV